MHQPIALTAEGPQEQLKSKTASHLGLIEPVQDIVPRSGKMIFFKRGGQRVMINVLGDMLVRPPIIEASMRQVPGGAHATGGGSMPPPPPLSLSPLPYPPLRHKSHNYSML